jgi:molybdopterin/thiamine biosynthesis adenylyltransferase/proteasome lid subunit RPN8/RPN11
MPNELESMNVTIVLPQQIAEKIDAVARLAVETAGVLLASIVTTDEGEIRLLARKMHWVPAAAYLRRGGDHLSIASEGYVPFLAEAESLGAVAIWVHTHPGLDSPPRPSDHDWKVDDQIADLFRLRSGSSYYGTLIFSPRPKGLAFSGYVQAQDGPRVPIERLWQVGDRLHLTRSFLLPGREMDTAFDRNVRALGGPVQEMLSDLRIGVVGCGGTGSAVAEQLVRLGVRRFVLFDPDKLSASNLTRVYGSVSGDVGMFKVETLAAHLKRIAPSSQCSLVKSMITLAPAAQRLCGCDVVFGCTDDNAGRLVLSRFSTFLLTPVFDSGVLVSSDANGALNGIDGRVTTLVPGQACLVCRGRIDLARAGAELMTPEERRRLEGEGYAPALGRTEPAVVAFTTLVAATAVSELLERLIGYGPEPRPSEVLVRCHDREISTNAEAPRARHYCDVSSGKLGIGITDPFLEQVWPA